MCGSQTFLENISTPCTSCRKLKQMMNNHNILTLDLFEGRDVGIALFPVPKFPNIERARLNWKSTVHKATED